MTRRLDAANSIVLRTGIPRGWIEYGTDEMVDIVGGGTPDRNETAYWRNADIPWVTPTDLTANSSRYISGGAENISQAGLSNSNTTLVQVGSVVFSTRGTVGKMALAATPLACNQSCEVLVPKPAKIDGEFLYYLLHFGLSAFLRLSCGTTFNAITRRDISRVRFAMPADLEEQKAIARILDAVDTAIERTRDAIERAEILSRSLLLSLLENGIDKNGKVRQREGNHDSYVEAEIGLIPNSWTVERLGDVAEVGRGRFSPRPRNDPRFYDGKYPFVQTGIVAKAKGRLIYDYEQTLNDQGKAVSREFAPGTILVTIAANIGETAILGIPMCVPDSIVGVCVRKPNVPRFVELCLRRLQPRLLAIAPRSAQHNINLSTLKPLRIPVPPPDEQQRIADVYDASLAYEDALLGKAEALRILKNSVMHDLLNGKVRVPVLS